MNQLFNKNKYTTWYWLLIEKAKLRTEILDYAEGHHIVPSSLGGTDHEDNLVKLSAREHFVAHLLLTKMTSGPARKKMSYAFSFMLTSNKKLKKRHLPSSRWYEYSRRLLSATQKGRMFLEETKEKMRESAIRRFRDPAQRSQISTWTKNPSQSTREKIGESARNRSPESLAKMKAAKNKRCTVDGRKIFPSRKDLANELGWGKDGAGSPHFRYV